MPNQTPVRGLARILALSFLLAAAVHAQPQIGGGTCGNASMTGVYYYLLSGNLLSGSQVTPYVELGQLTADGRGRFSGFSRTGVGGPISAHTLAGTYSVQSNCTGTMALTVDSQPGGSISFQVVNDGAGATFAFSTGAGVVTGRAYRQAVAAGQSQCTAATLSGSYAFLLTGLVFQSGSRLYYSQIGNVIGDGRGNLTATGMANVSGTSVTVNGQGSYVVGNDCSGTVSIRNPNGTANYYIAVVEGGKTVLFMESDSNYVVAGSAHPSFATPQSAVVNAANFDPESLAPGAIFSVFGRDLPKSAEEAQVLVNGENAPVFFANGSQVNAQLPFTTPTDRPVTLSLVSGRASSNAVQLELRRAAPGIFTYAGNRAVAQNQDYSLNSPSNPARVGDALVAYLTGPGAVSPSATTGQAAPSSPLALVEAPYSFTIGGATAAVSFFGLTPGFVGLYQANLTVPVLTPGEHPLVATVAGAASNRPLVSVR